MNIGFAYCLTYERIDSVVLQLSLRLLQLSGASCVIANNFLTCLLVRNDGMSHHLTINQFGIWGELDSDLSGAGLVSDVEVSKVHAEGHNDSNC